MLSLVNEVEGCIKNIWNMGNMVCTSSRWLKRWSTSIGITLVRFLWIWMHSTVWQLDWSRNGNLYLIYWTCELFVLRRCSSWVDGWNSWPSHTKKTPKFEHIFVAATTFSPFLLCRYFYYQLVAYCVCFKMICEMSL